MAAEKPEKGEKRSKEEKRARKEKKEKKRSETDGVHKEKKDRKEEKARKAALEMSVSTVLDEQLQAQVAQFEGNWDKALQEALVPFAVPLVPDTSMLVLLKVVRMAAEADALRRGVKEVVKQLRKSPAANPLDTKVPGVVIIAGDIYPADVISHLPVLCEDHRALYIFTKSRTELGNAAKTKRPTSVVMVLGPDSAKSKKKKDKADEDTAVEEATPTADGQIKFKNFSQAFAALVELVNRETNLQAFWL